MTIYQGFLYSDLRLKPTVPKILISPSSLLTPIYWEKSDGMKLQDGIVEFLGCRLLGHFRGFGPAAEY